MELENNYLRYEEYLNYGGTLSSLPFQRLEKKAEQKVNLYTFDRFKNIEEYPNELKMCIFELIELFTTDNNSYSSESIGNYSISTSNVIEKLSIEKNLITTWLNDVKVDDIPVLYRG